MSENSEQRTPDEVKALGVMVDAILHFDESTRLRMLEYLADRFASCVLRPAQRRDKTEPITEELWAAIKKHRPKAFETLQNLGVCDVIITVGTSRTKLDFPMCPNMTHGCPAWTDFDRQVHNPDRPCIVLDGSPENGFTRYPGIGLAG